MSTNTQRIASLETAVLALTEGQSRQQVTLDAILARLTAPAPAAPVTATPEKVKTPARTPIADAVSKSKAQKVLARNTPAPDAQGRKPKYTGVALAQEFEGIAYLTVRSLAGAARKFLGSDTYAVAGKPYAESKTYWVPNMTIARTLADALNK